MATTIAHSRLEHSSSLVSRHTKRSLRIVTASCCCLYISLQSSQYSSSRQARTLTGSPPPHASKPIRAKKHPTEMQGKRGEHTPIQPLRSRKACPLPRSLTTYGSSSKELKAQAAPVKHTAPIAAIRIHGAGLPSSPAPIDRRDPPTHSSEGLRVIFCGLTISGWLVELGVASRVLGVTGCVLGFVFTKRRFQYSN